MEYFPKELTTFEYYYSKLPLYLQQSYGYPEHFRIMQETILNIVNIGNKILEAFDINADNYLDFINSFGSETNNDLLDKIGSIWGVPRQLTVQSESSETLSNSGALQITSSTSPLQHVGLGYEPTTFSFEYDDTWNVFIALDFSRNNEIYVTTNVSPANWVMKIQTDYTDPVDMTYTATGLGLFSGSPNPLDPLPTYFYVRVLSYDNGVYHCSFEDDPPTGSIASILIKQRGTPQHVAVPVSGTYTENTNTIQIVNDGFDYRVGGEDWENDTIYQQSGRLGTGPSGTEYSVYLGYRPDVVAFEYVYDSEGDPDEDIPAETRIYRYSITNDWYGDEPTSEYIKITNTGFVYQLASTDWGDGYAHDGQYTAGRVASKGGRYNPGYACSGTISAGGLSTITLSNELYVMLIKAVICRAFYDGSREQAEEAYKRMGLKIGYGQDPSDNLKCTLYLETALDNRELITVFKNGLLTISSMGIEYEYEVVEEPIS